MTVTYDIDYLHNAQERIRLAIDMRRTSEEAQAIAQIAIAEALIAITEQLRAANHLALVVGKPVSADTVMRLLPLHVRHALWPDGLVPEEPPC